MAGSLDFSSVDDRLDVRGDDGLHAARKDSKASLRIRLPRPPTHKQARSGSDVSDVMPNSMYRMRVSLALPSLSSTIQSAPESVPTTASESVIPTTLVKVLSARAPKTQFLPERAFGAVLLGPSPVLARDLVGDAGLISGSLQTFTCRTPTL